METQTRMGSEVLRTVGRVEATQTVSDPAILIEPYETIETAANPRLIKAQHRIKSLTDLIRKQLQPEIESLRKENKELVLLSARQTPNPTGNNTGNEDRNAELMKAMNHLEKRFVQSEAISKKTIEDLKGQLEAERKEKKRLQKELEALVKDLDHGITHLPFSPQHETTVYQAQEAKAEAFESQLLSLQTLFPKSQPSTNKTSASVSQPWNRL